MSRLVSRCVVGLMTLALTSSGTAFAQAAAPQAADRQAGSVVPRWAAGWAASVQVPAESFGGNWAARGFRDQTVRQVFRVSTGGAAARIRLSNAYGTGPLPVTGVSVARTGPHGSTLPGSAQPLTFGGAESVAIPPGGEVPSDPVPLPVAPLESLTVTMYFAEATGPVTFHGMAGATSYRAPGDHRVDRAGNAFNETSQSWYGISGVDVIGPLPHRRSVAAFGDSITDGTASTADADNRYPDELAERLAWQGTPVLNAGIGGNRVLNDSLCAGESAVDRFRRDVLDQPGVGSVIVLEGINDIGMSEFDGGVCFHPNPEVTAQDLIEGHRELIRQAHAEGIKAVGGTLLPFKGTGYFTERGEAVRDALNDWIRTSGEYDAVVDFDRELAAPGDPDLLDPAYDSGDHLHPSDAGYHAMAAAVDPLEL